MGSASSKTRRFDGVGSPSSSFSSSVSSIAVVEGSSSSNNNRRKFRARSIFHSSCLGSTSRTCDSDDDNPIPDPGRERNGIADYGQQMQRNELISNEVKIECYRDLKIEQPEEMACVSSNVDLTEWIQASESANGSPPPTSSSQPLNKSSRFRSCFNIPPSNVSFRLSRASSLRSVREDPDSLANFTVQNSREEFHLPSRSGIGSIGRHENQEDSYLHPSVSSVSPRQYYSGSAGNSASASSSMDYYPIISNRSLVIDNVSRRTRGDASSPYSRNIEMHNVNTRHATREPMDCNSRFSRTLSVGRLRDRVLRRPSFSDLTFPPLQQERVLTSDLNEVHGVNASTVETRTATVAENPVVSLASSYRGYSSQNVDNEASQFRGSRLNDILQQRSSFLERQRRIRSRVRALQRSRFETLSGHERSCVVSGNHRTGRCTCHMNTRGPSSNDDTSARASISRIVMLAEALFEVLDEIHQQSAVLPSQPSVSSIGSIPAPSEVVESLPLKVYSKPSKFQSDEAGQCDVVIDEARHSFTIRPKKSYN
ncbi:hypothetical protein V2J09_004834 [Rumex salicifolius]